MKRTNPRSLSPAQRSAVKTLAAMRELAGNLWWAGDAQAIGFWEDVHALLRCGPFDRERVEEGKVPRIWRDGPAGPEPSSPLRLLRRDSAKLLRLLPDRPELRETALEIHQRFRAAVQARRPPPPKFRIGGPVAYFSMEFGVHESLPIYAGGLGILAGDHVKSAGDLRLPLAGVGLFYHQGYFRQEVDTRGRHRVKYPRADLRDLPLRVAHDPRGRELRIPVELPGRSAWFRVFLAPVGAVNLILLDANLPENLARDRRITDRLYIGDREMRIAQEIACGIGGVRALRALGIRPAVWHLNEGHVAFQALERIRELTGRGAVDFAEAAEIVAGDTVFTTHTPVPEGNEAFTLDLARRYLAPHCEPAGVPVDEFLRLGLDRAKDGRVFFSMTVLALRLSRFRNGVSRLHGQVSRKMWNHLWPGFAPEEVPIDSITNGVHVPTWVYRHFSDAFDGHAGRGWAHRLERASTWKGIRRVSMGTLFVLKNAARRRLVNFVRERWVRDATRSGRPLEAARRDGEKLLDPDALTIGFARRFALYKRAALLFRDLRAARRLFNDPERPVQIIFAGKPHPEDARGAQLFNRIAAIARRPEFSGKVVLLSNYDPGVARRLVQGCDLWLNNPRRPQEACGTSGQKVPINCGLNLSILDGWWPEGFEVGETGWAIGKPIDYADPERQDREDNKDLYGVLTKEVIPLFYDRDRRNVPTRWLERAVGAMEALAPRFSSARMVAEYVRKLYRPAVENGRRLRAGGGGAARELVAWRRRVERSWPLIHVRRSLRTSARAGEVEIFAAGLGPQDLAADARVIGARVADVRMGAAVRSVAPPPAFGEGILRFRFPLAGSSPACFRVWPRSRLLPHSKELGVALETTV